MTTRNHLPHLEARPSGIRGFTLVEIMVGVAIGLIGMLAILRMVAVWDQHTRSATSGDDAQVAGTLATFALEREIRNAGLGLGLAPPSAMGCLVDAHNDNRLTTQDFTFRLRPVEIAVGVGGAPDVITVLSGNSAFFTEREVFGNATATTKRALRPETFREGDLAVVAGTSAGLGAGDCALVQITGRDPADARTLRHAVGPYVDFYGRPNPQGVFNTAAGTGVAYLDGVLLNLGPQPSLHRWAIPANTASLRRTDLIANTAAETVAEGVVNMKAEYGYDFDGDQRVADTPAGSEWRTTLPNDPGPPPLHPNWTLVRAIRISLLVRSRQFEKPADSALSVAPTPDEPRWTHGDGTTEAFTMTNIDGGPDSFTPVQPDPNNWRYYRYRVYERVIPLRNMIWGVQLP